MKMLKKFTALFLIIAVMMCSTLTAFATELAGDEVVDCNGTVNISDSTGEYKGNQIVVYFEDITGTASETLHLTKSVGWGSEEPVNFVLPAPTTYNITFSGVENGYQIIDTATGKAAETKFAATESGVAFNWAIALVEETKKETASETASVPVENQDAQTAYKEFLDAVSFMADDESWYEGYGSTLTLFEKDTISGQLYCKWYVKYVQGGTEEKFYAMTPFERFVWTNTYTRLAFAVADSNDFNGYFGTKDNFTVNIVNQVLHSLSGNNKEVVEEAYIKLMDWQYNYVTEHGVPFNFINNRSYIEEKNAVPEKQESSSMSAEEELEYIQEQIKEELSEEEEQGIWTNTLDKLAQNALSLAIILILCCILGVMVYIRKSRNIDDK